MQQPINNNKQTAVEWLIQEIESKGDAWENASIKKIQISIDASEYAELKAQAKEMEKQQHQETFKQSRLAEIFKKDMPPVWESWEHYYNETYNN
jgi:saccharopine dehydrogenase-like NADP-dependent oxidoreductase